MIIFDVYSFKDAAKISPGLFNLFKTFGIKEQNADGRVMDPEVDERQRRTKGQTLGMHIIQEEDIH